MMRIMISRTPATLFIGAAFLMSPLFRTNATTIVIARSATEIVIGADSKVTNAYGNELNSQVCKIQRCNSIFWRDRGNRRLTRGD
jgi:hypothetical protein